MRAPQARTTRPIRLSYLLRTHVHPVNVSIFKNAGGINATPWPSLTWNCAISFNVRYTVYWLSSVSTTRIAYSATCGDAEWRACILITFSLRSLFTRVAHLGVSRRVLSEELHVCQVPEFIRSTLRLLLLLSAHLYLFSAPPSRHPRIPELI